VNADRRLLGVGIASIWLLTGLLVVHPYFRAVGASYLDRWGLPHSLMVATCVFEIVLGTWVLAGRMTRFLAGLQLVLVVSFTVILAAAEPMLLVHPFGMLTKNIPILAMIVTAALVDAEGWSPRALSVLRIGMAVIWVTEGLLPKILFQQDMELRVVAESRLVPMDPSRFLVGMGLAQALSGVLVLVWRGAPRRFLLAGQIAALVVLPLLVSWQQPLLWAHPFGPMTKTLPLVAGTLVVWRRSSDASVDSR
jgi:uncharacterized membrane protein YphA (DoxX/SURF4 family)